MRRILSILACALVSLIASVPGFAATFPGSARVEVNDPTGGLSWSNSVNALTVSCWFKISVPSDKTISENMTILVDRRTGSEANNFAYLIRFNASNGNVEFLARGTSGIYSNTLIQSPYLDRWYHVAVVRDGESETGYVDGRQVFISGTTIGNAANTDGVTIGGWASVGSGNYLYGEVQEVAIYQAALSQEFITEFMFDDQPALPELMGYYKLAYSSNFANQLKNFAPTPPTSTDPATTQGSGNIAFEEVSEAGEQSAFDSRKNRGDNAITPLSGSYAWEQTVLARPTPGIAFDLKLGYNSANAYNGFKLGGFDPFASSTLGKGWRQTFDTRVIPSQYFSPVAGIDTIGLMTWDGSVETWDLDYDSNTYKTRHNEYRGEISLIGNICEWVTPDRRVYRFKHPFSGSTIMRGRLLEIRDYGTNSVKILWNETLGIVTQVVDSAGGRYDFSYNGQHLLTNVFFQGWSVNFEYDNSQSLLTNKYLVAPAAYSNINSRWSFSYTNSVLNFIRDPRGNTNAFVRYDKYGRVIEERDALGRSKKTDYGVPGTRQITHTDPANQKWIETYDRKGRLVSQADPLGNATSYAYDNAGNRISITEPLGWKSTFAYDSRANILAKTNALGQVSTSTYHSFFNKPLTQTDPLGNTTTYTYNDTTGNLLSQFDSIGTLVTYTYSTNGLLLTAKDANNNITSFTYTPDGFLASKTDPAGNITRYARNEFGWALSETNALGQATAYSYDINGNVVQRVDPLPRTYTSVYDPNGNLVVQSDAMSHFITNSFDAANQKTQTVDRVGSKWGYTYTPRGQIEKIIDPLSSVVSNSYDNVNRLVAVFDPLGNASSNIYDSNGNKIALIDKVGQRWPKTYDRLNRVVAESDPFGNAKQTAYDAAGRIKTITTPNGYPSTHDYDPRGRLTKWVDAEGFNWLYTYDSNGNIVDITDALGGHYAMSYSNRNERVLEENQDHFKWRYSYDELLRLKTQTDPNGTVRTATYDDGGRITTVGFSTGRADNFIYDNNNNPLNITRFVPPSSSTTSHFEYDAMDRVTKYRDTFNKEVLYSYDAVGRVKTLTYPDTKALTYNYDKLGRLTNTVDWASRNMWYDYDKADHLTRRTYPNGITQTNAFDNAGRLTDLQYKTPTNSVLMALSYAYDRNGNKTSEKEQGTFDWPQPSRHDETARYTASGRLIDKLDAAQTNNNFTYAYDATGNMTNAVGAGQSFAFTYDEDNRVVILGWETGITAKTIQNRYDALGRRISRKQDGDETRYVIDLQGSMERILCDVTNNFIIAYYIHGPDLCYKVTPGPTETITCYHADAQANIIALTDGGGTNVARYAYTPYGRSLGSQSSVLGYQPFLFVGSQGVMEDPPGSGLYFMRARYYSADTGTFLSTDPVKHIGPNWKPADFPYGDGNPLTHVDPKGESSVGIMLGRIGIKSAVKYFGFDPANWGEALHGEGNWGDALYGAIADAAKYGLKYAAEAITKLLGYAPAVATKAGTYVGWAATWPLAIIGEIPLQGGPMYDFPLSDNNGRGGSVQTVNNSIEAGSSETVDTRVDQKIKDKTVEEANPVAELLNGQQGKNGGGGGLSLLNDPSKSDKLMCTSDQGNKQPETQTKSTGSIMQVMKFVFRTIFTPWKKK